MEIPYLPGFIPGILKAGQIMAIMAIAIYQAGQSTRRGTTVQSLAPPFLVLTITLFVGVVASAFLTYGLRAIGLFALILPVCLAASATWPRRSAGTGIAELAGAGFSGVGLGLAAMPVDGVMPDLLVPLLVNVFAGLLAVIGLWRFCLAAAQGPFWAMIGLRIIAAWIAAIALMMLAFLIA